MSNREEVDGMIATVDDLLVLARADEGGLRLNRSPSICGSWPAAPCNGSGLTPVVITSSSPPMAHQPASARTQRVSTKCCAT